MNQIRRFDGWAKIPAILAAAILPNLINFNSFWLMDDTKQIQRGMTSGFRNLILDPYILPDNLFRPLMVLLSRCDGLIWGARAWGYRLTNIILFCVSCMLVMTIARRFLKPVEAWLAAMIFAVHPMQVGTVVWLTGRVDLLPGTLIFAGAALLLNTREPWKRVAGHIIFALALLSKETAMVFPAALFVGEIMSGVSRRDAVRRALPSFMMVFVYISLRAAFNFLPGSDYYHPNSMLNPTLVVRNSLCLALNTLYMFIPLLNPMDILRVDFPKYPGLFNTLFNSKTIPVAIYVSGGIGLLAAWIYNAVRHSGERRSAIFGASWYFIFIIPTFHVLANMAGTRYFHIALLGGVIFMVWSASSALKYSSRRARRAIAITFALICLAANVIEQFKWREASDIAENLTHSVILYSNSLPAEASLIVADLPEFTPSGRLIYPPWDNYSLPMSFGFLRGRKDVKVTVEKTLPPQCDRITVFCENAESLLTAHRSFQ